MKVSKTDIADFFKTDRAILIICIGIALLFWLFTKMSQTFRSSKTFELSYNLPVGKSFADLPPKKLEAYISGRGWDLMSSHLRNASPKISFDLAKDSIQTIYRNDIRSSVEELLSSTLNTTDFDYERIDIRLENEDVKKVPIVFKNEINFFENHQLKSLKITPDSISISGPLSLIEGIDSWPTSLIKRDKLKSNETIEVSLSEPKAPQIHIMPNVATIDLKIEQFTENSFFLPILIKNAPDTLKIFPDRVKLTYIVGLSDYEAIHPSHFQLEVDLAGIPLETENNTLPINLGRKSELVRNINFSPNSVEFFFVQNKEGNISNSDEN